MLEEIIERENLPSSQVNQSDKAKVDNEGKAAEEIRKRAIESMSNTGEPPKKRVRRDGSDATEYLKEKYKIESRLREQEMQLEKQHRAQNSGRSPDNDRPRMPLDLSLLYLTGHFDRPSDRILNRFFSSAYLLKSCQRKTVYFMASTQFHCKYVKLCTTKTLFVLVIYNVIANVLSV